MASITVEPPRPTAATTAPDPIEQFRRRFAAAIDAGDPAPAARRWRLGLFERGLKLADELERRTGPLAGRRLLDVGCAHGGDVAAFVARGASCVGMDMFDHGYDRLEAELDAGPRLSFSLADCTAGWPFPNDAFDVVISFSVLEIVDDLDHFFRELRRVLRPGGCAIVDTGCALRMARLDPLYKLPLIALLPAPLRVWVAGKIFRRQYRFHVSRHTFYSAAKFKRYVEQRHLRVCPDKYAGSPIMHRTAGWPLSGVWHFLLRWLAYDFVFLRPAPPSASAATNVRDH